MKSRSYSTTAACASLHAQLWLWTAAGGFWITFRLHLSHGLLIRPQRFQNMSSSKTLQQVCFAGRWFASCGCNSLYALYIAHSCAPTQVSNAFRVSLQSAELPAGVQGPFTDLMKRSGCCFVGLCLAISLATTAFLLYLSSALFGDRARLAVAFVESKQSNARLAQECRAQQVRICAHCQAAIQPISCLLD